MAYYYYGLIFEKREGLEFLLKHNIDNINTKKVQKIEFDTSANYPRYVMKETDIYYKDLIENYLAIGENHLAYEEENYKFDENVENYITGNISIKDDRFSFQQIDESMKHYFKVRDHYLFIVQLSGISIYGVFNKDINNYDFEKYDGIFKKFTDKKPQLMILSHGCDNCGY